MSYYRDVLAKDKMITNKGIYKRYTIIHEISNEGYFKYKIFTIYSRYEIEWIGREGLAPETHDAYLKVKVIFGSYFL